MTRRERLFWIGVYGLIAGLQVRTLSGDPVSGWRIAYLLGLVGCGVRLGYLVAREQLAMRRDQTQVSERWLATVRQRDLDSPGGGSDRARRPDIAR